MKNKIIKLRLSDILWVIIPFAFMMYSIGGFNAKFNYIKDRSKIFRSELDSLKLDIVQERDDPYGFQELTPERIMEIDSILNDICEHLSKRMNTRSRGEIKIDLTNSGISFNNGIIKLQ